MIYSAKVMPTPNTFIDRSQYCLSRAFRLKNVTVVEVEIMVDWSCNVCSVLFIGRMPEGITPENLLNNIMDTLSDNMSRQNSGSFFQEDRTSSVTCQFNRLFGRQKPVHHILGGGKSADVLLWRNKKISASVLTGATAIWVIFEWLNYNLLTFLAFGLVIGMIVQFVWANALKGRQSEIPRLVIPDELFVNIARKVGAEVNRGLYFIQDIACQGTLKQFLVVVLSLWAAAIAGSWCNFLTLIYIGFVGAHTLPVLYEKYEDEVDGFVTRLLDQFQHHYKKMDTSVLRRFPTRNFRGKKNE
ncbi:membrane traffic protein [Lithospermum erythrorhizon]|uniref:Reticulon-like protein n=1 Tax=Lithospermum erythrorhizon TaxID=34254 RepID=A0AAV3S0U0_LITER